MSVIYTSSVYSKNKKKSADGITYDYYLTVDLQSQDIVNNRSTVLITLYLQASRNTGTLMWSTSKANAPEGTITVDGTTYNSSISVGTASSAVYIDDGKIRRYSRSTTATAINTQTLTINHNTDGTKYLPISFNWVAGSGDTTNFYPVSFASDGATITIPAIPRQSIIECNNSVTLNNNTSTFSYSVKSYADYYHVLSWTLDNTTTNVWTSGSPHRVNNTTETLTIGYGTLLNALQTAATKTLTFTLKTYTDSGLGTLVGTTTKSVSVSVDPSVYKPTLTINSISPNSTPISGKLVAGKSTATVSFTSAKPQGTTGLTIYFSISTGSMANATSTTVGSGTVSTNTLPASNTNYLFVVTAYAVDSRGVSSNTVTSTSASVYAYAQPFITANAYRVTANGSTTADDAGDYVYITYNATCSSVGASNSIQSKGCTFNGNPYANASWAYLSTDSQGSFVFTATDRVMTATKTIVVSTAKFPLDLYDDGTALHMGVGLAGALAEADKVKSAKDVYAPTFRGDLVGNADTATTATNANKVKVTNNAFTSTLTSYYPTIVTGTATGNYDENLNENIRFQHQTGTTATPGQDVLTLGNSTASGTAGNSEGRIRLFSQSTGYVYIRPTLDTTGTKNIYLPKTTGTLQLAPTSVWTGTLQGGNSQAMSLSGYSRIKIYAQLYGLSLIFEMDLSRTSAITGADGAYTADDAYRASGTHAYWSASRVEVYYAEVGVNSAKSTMYFRRVGYTYGTSYDNTRNNNANYFIYKVEGFV